MITLRYDHILFLHYLLPIAIYFICALDDRIITPTHHKQLINHHYPITPLWYWGIHIEPLIPSLDDVIDVNSGAITIPSDNFGAPLFEPCFLCFEHILPNQESTCHSYF